MGPGGQAKFQVHGCRRVAIGLAVTDNDEEVHKQMSYAYLRTANQTSSPWAGGESAWNFAIKLVPKPSLFAW
jgi:hypothetical protein